MSTELSGRALDEAAARAMGWKTSLCIGATAEYFDGWICDGCRMVQGRWGDEFPDEHNVPTPLYSTDPAHIPEMLAWLHEFSQVTIYSNSKATVADLASMNMSATGRTISEALARLVVAVKEAQQ